MLRSRLSLLFVSMSAAALSACVVAPYPPQRVVYAQPVPAPLPAPVQYQSDVQPVPSYEAEAPLVVDVAPPPPMVEVVPALPFAGALWIGGYWGWSGGRHQWIGGHYERPRPGYAWRPHAWVNVGGRWHSQGGGWVRR